MNHQLKVIQLMSDLVSRGLLSQLGFKCHASPPREVIFKVCLSSKCIRSPGEHLYAYQMRFCWVVPNFFNAILLTGNSFTRVENKMLSEIYWSSIWCSFSQFFHLYFLYSTFFTVCACMLNRFSHVQLFPTPRTVTTRLLCSWDFLGKSGLPFPPPGHLPNPGVEPKSPALASRFSTHWATWKAHHFTVYLCK